MLKILKVYMMKSAVNKTSFGHRVWSKKDRERLLLAYKCGASLDIISRILKRTVTSINKALTRCGARQDPDYINNQHRHFDHSLTYEKVMDIITEYEKKYDCGTVQSSNIEPITGPKSHSLPVFDHLFKHNSHPLKSEIFINLNRFLRINRKIGFNIQPLHHQFLNSLGLVFMLNNHPVTKSQLLCHINKVRLQQGYAIFHVDGITSDH